MQRKNVEQYYSTTVGWQELPADRRDHLFGWYYKSDVDTSGRSALFVDLVNDIYGIDAATDADQDIAMALLQAAEIWSDDVDALMWRKEAEDIIEDIWRKETRYLPSTGMRYLTAGDVHARGANGWFNVNPSYCRPSYYEKFAEFHTPSDGVWTQLIEDCYVLLEQCIRATYNTPTSPITGSTGLPPDWFSIRESDGSIGAYIWEEHHSATSSYDAYRTHYWVACDYFQSGGVRESAKRYLLEYGPLDFLLSELRSNLYLQAGYRIDGTDIGEAGTDINNENWGSNGVYLAFFSAAADARPEDQELILHRNYLRSRLSDNDNSYYHSSGYWGVAGEYYGQHWAYFGLALDAKLCILSASGQHSGDFTATPQGICLAPNPAISTLTIGYTNPTPGDVTIRIWDITGRLHYNRLHFLPGIGKHFMQVDASCLPAGAYRCMVESRSHVDIGSLLIVK